MAISAARTSSRKRFPTTVHPAWMSSRDFHTRSHTVCQSQSGRRSVTKLHDELVHPGRHHHVERNPVRSRQQEEIAAAGGLEGGHLPVGQAEGFLHLDGLRVLQRAQQK